MGLSKHDSHSGAIQLRQDNLTLYFLSVGNQYLLTYNAIKLHGSKLDFPTVVSSIQVYLAII